MRRLLFLLLLSSVCFFTLSEVVDNNFSKCKQFFLNNAPPDFTPANGVSVKPICQCLWNDKDEQVYLYATLYSTTWKIPVYSAYRFGSPNIGRCDAWYIEPQLDGDDEPCMQPTGYGTNIGNNQALYKDYYKSGYDKGHLYPVLHTNNHLSMLATSTMTNAAPQDRAFNQKQWLEHEKTVIKDLESCDDPLKAYVVTGVVPNLNKNVPKLKGRVTVSLYYWRATCCLKGGLYTGKGYYGPDNGIVKELPITELQDMLKAFYNIQIFPSIPKVTPPKRPRSENACN
ncbi:endonuclease domain-containing 1 protein-like [Ctenopharyngodon idella]|uniref:endonuclease domain-containing 1 protein-like n=1 Tax=Ctenopharyngodon idella TaxID=7959 RepID=UPI00222E3F4B|nr:endonuclease domain-containing 1 protein-like [Ctenopharyngodon idella]